LSLRDITTSFGSRIRRQKASIGPVEGSNDISGRACSSRQGSPGLGHKYCDLDLNELANQEFSLCCIMNLLQEGKIIAMNLKFGIGV